MKNRKKRAKPAPPDAKAEPLNPEELTCSALREELDGLAGQPAAQALAEDEFTVCALRNELESAGPGPIAQVQPEPDGAGASAQQVTTTQDPAPGMRPAVPSDALSADEFTVAALREDPPAGGRPVNPLPASLHPAAGDEADTQAGLEVEAAEVQNRMEEAFSTSGFSLGAEAITAVSRGNGATVDVASGWARSELEIGPDDLDLGHVPEAATHQIAVKGSGKPAVVPQFIPTGGPIHLLVLADYPGPGTLMTGLPFWGDGPISRMVATALHRNDCCDDFTVAMAQLPAVELVRSSARPRFRNVAITYIHSELLEGGVCSIEEVVAKRNLDRLRGVIETAVTRCPGRLHAVTFGAIAKFVLRAMLYGSIWDVDMTSLQSPSIGVGSERFDERGWIDWAAVAMQTEYSLK